MNKEDKDLISKVVHRLVVFPRCGGGIKCMCLKCTRKSIKSKKDVIK